MSFINRLFTLWGEIAINNQQANDEIDETTGKAKDLGDALNSTGSNADTAAGKIGSTSKLNSAAVWLGQTLSTLTEKTAKVAFDLGKIGFGFNMSMESYQYQFEALLNDSDKAAQLIADIQQLAKISPLGMEGLAKNATMLLQQGIELADIIPTLETLGNLSLGNTENMNSVVRAYTQIISKGGLMAQEMYQLGDAMVPIVEIMTKYGGERYADGSWYQQKMTDPTYKIPAEDMIKAFNAATAEGGKWHDYMFTIMDSFAGQADRLGEEGKETLGAFFQPFFEMAKSDVLPNLTASLESFRTWITENKSTLELMAEAVGNLVSTGFDKLLNAFKWMTENGDAVGIVLTTIATGMAIGAIAAHPYAAAITAIAAGLALLSSTGANYDNILDKYSDDELQNLQKYIEAMRAVQVAEQEWEASWGTAKESENLKRLQELEAVAVSLKENISDALLIDYSTWKLAQPGNQDEDLYLDVPLRVSDNSENVIQSDINGMQLEGVVKLYPDTSAIPDAVYAIASGQGVSTNWNAEGAIFSEPTIFNTRLGLQGVGEAGAEAVAPITKLQQYVSDAVRGVVGGMQFNIVLDSGVLVGQLAPKLDAQFGTMASRKGRGN